MHDPLRAMRDPFGTMPEAKREGRSVVRTALSNAWAATRPSNDGMPWAKVSMLPLFLVTPRLFLATLSLVLTTPRPQVLTTLRHSRRRAVGRGRAVLVLTTPRQNRGRAVPSRGTGSERVGSSWERATTRPAHIGMPKECSSRPPRRSRCDRPATRICVGPITATPAPCVGSLG
jgi:hypothetical protein